MKLYHRKTFINKQQQQQQQLQQQQQQQMQESNLFLQTVTFINLCSYCFPSE